MFFYTFILFFFIAASLDLTQAKMVSFKRQDQSEGLNDYTPQDTGSQRKAIAHLKGHFGIKGSIEFDAHGNDEVEVSLSIKGLDKYSGPSQGGFSYHIHLHSIEGGCDSALGHLNPYNVLATQACDPKNIKTCEVGDLSGKHGKLIPRRHHKTTTTYIDSQIKFSSDRFGFLGRSVVVHDSNKNRIACGTIEVQSSKDLGISLSAPA